MQKIFIVEDDDNIRDMVLYALSSKEFDAEGFPNGEAFWDAMKSELPSIILLDIMLPGEDGIEILKKIRQSTKYKSIPVIILTAKGSEYDRIKGLDLGADDYISKPFSILEAISRIKAVLRRCGNNENDNTEIVIGKLSIVLNKRRVVADGVEIQLTFKEFELLYYLMLNEGIVLSRDKLLQNVWCFDFGGESRTVDMHIRTLRQKLLHCGDMIKTVRNVGYKIEG